MRNGTCNLFMFSAPLSGWRRVEAAECRTRRDWAEQIRSLVDEDFPSAEIELSVLNNHGLAERVEDLSSMRQQVNVWTTKRNAGANKIDWRFTNKDARVKLKHLYPNI